GPWRPRGTTCSSKLGGASPLPARREESRNRWPPESRNEKTECRQGYLPVGRCATAALVCAAALREAAADIRPRLLQAERLCRRCLAAPYSGSCHCPRLAPAP